MLREVGEEAPSSDTDCLADFAGRLARVFIWNECSRLIANTIIYYNTLLLSRVYKQKAAAGDLEAIHILKSTSPVAWRNINLIGNFDFTDASSVVDIEALAAHYQNEDFWKRSMTESNDDGPQ